MKHCRRSYVAVLAAVAGIYFFTGPVVGQIRLDTNGHATDANPQIGSGGYNQAPNGTQANWAQYQNALLNNNAGGFGPAGRGYTAFNLGAAYINPFGFRGLMAGQGLDQFVSLSSGIPTTNNPSASNGMPSGSQQIFNGLANHSVAPPGLPNPSYVAGQPVTQAPEDLRLGAIEFSGQSQVLPKPNEMILPGPVDPTANPNTPAQQQLYASTIYGVLAFSPQQPALQDQNNPQSAIFGPSPLQQGGISPALAPNPIQAQMKELRQELDAQSKNGIGMPNASNDVGASLPKSIQPGNLSQQLPSLAPETSLSKSANVAPAAGDVDTGQSSRQYLPNDENLPPPIRQSALYAKLRQNMDDYNSANSMTDEQANRKFQEIVRLRNLASTNAERGSNVLSGPGAAATANPGELPGGIPNPEESAGPGRSPNAGPGSGSEQKNRLAKPGFTTMPSNMGAAPGLSLPPVAAPPVPIDSFASGIHAKGLADLIANAELNVEQHHYDKAIAQYNEAIDVAPNNPLILMARATAELGGGYYAQANADIHLAVAQDPAVLLGQYDLQKHLGADRLKSVLADLKQMAKESDDDTLHAFLLAFAYYNSQHVAQAVDWLAITDKRAKGQDLAILQMKKYWNFNEDQQPVLTPPVANPSSEAPSSRPSGKN
jgi:tetratricopeptide (TPR) repeat protein